MTKSEKSTSHAYEPLVDLTGEETAASSAEEFSLEDLMPTNAYERAGIFTRALKYMNFDAKKDA